MTVEVKQAVRACFEAEAAGLSLAICIPEVVARDELMADERFQVRRDGEVVSCKCCCTTCGSNAFVLIGSINVNDKTRVRFVYTPTGAIMPIAPDYICVDPSWVAGRVGIDVNR